MIVKIQVRRGLSTQWTSVNPILSSGEFGYETDTGKLKIGNGTSAWIDLDYKEGIELTSAITGYTVGANTPLSDTDSILEAFGKVQGQINAKQNLITAGTTLQYYRGDKTFQTLDTLAVPELTNLYFTETRVRESVLTGYTVGANTALSATDSVLGAFQKVQAQINARVSGIGVISQVPFFTSTSAIGSDSAFVWNNSTKQLSVGSISGGSTAISTTGSIAIRSRPDVFQNGFIQIRHNASNVLDVGMALESSKNGTVNVRVDLSLDSISFRTNSINSVSTERWLITNSGILASVGAQTIRTNTGNLTIATNGGNGNILLTPNGTGLVMIGSGTPTNTLDVNGTARIRVRANSAGNFGTWSATGVAQERTALESANDILKSISGYNAGVNQRLEHNSSGVLNWVNT